jgi:GAF domain-containing protein
VTWVATTISPAAFTAENLTLLQSAARQAEDAIRTSELSGQVFDRGEQDR